MKKIVIVLIALFMTFGISSCTSNGQTPYIGDNGNWWIGETDLGVPATGEDGKDGTDGSSITVSSVEKTSSNGLIDTYTITFSDGTLTTFTVTNGESSVVESIELTASNGLADTYTITFTNGSTKTFTVTNGQDGSNLTITSIALKSSVGLIDTYEISYSDGSKFEFVVSNGANGLTPYIGDNGNWWIGDSDTGVLVDYEKANNVPLTDYSNGLAYITMTVAGKTGYVVTNWAQERFSEYMTYKFLSEGISQNEIKTYVTNAISGISEGHLVIPNYIGSVPVVGVLDEVKLNFNKVTLSRNTVWLGAAFTYCENLHYIDFNNCNLKYIQNNTFKNTALTSVILPSSVSVIGDDAFSGVPLTDINLDNVTYIGDDAFDSLVTKNGVYLPKSIKYIGSRAFASTFLYLEHESIPETWGKPLTTNSYNGLTPVNCKNNGEYIYSLNENSATIYQYLGDNVNIVIPSEIDGKTVTTIGYGFESNVPYTLNFTISSFESLSSIFPHKEIVLPSTVTEIEFFAFFGINMTIFASSSLKIISETLLWALIEGDDLAAINVSGETVYAQANFLALAGNDMPQVMDGSSIAQTDDSYTKEYIETNLYRIGFNVDYSNVESDSSFYYLNNGNSYSLLSYKGFTSQNLVIPGKFNDKPVTTILSKAIGLDSTIETITIENGIERIKPLAILCQKVTSIFVPLSVVVINAEGIKSKSNKTVIYCYSPSKPIDWDSNWTNILSNAVFNYSLS